MNQIQFFLNLFYTAYKDQTTEKFNIWFIKNKINLFSFQAPENPPVVWPWC